MSFELDGDPFVPSGSDRGVVTPTIAAAAPVPANDMRRAAALDLTRENTLPPSHFSVIGPEAIS